MRHRELRFAASRSRQFVHGNAHLPDQLAQLSPLGWRLRGLKPPRQVAVTLASGGSSAATAMHATSSIWHRGRNPVPREVKVEILRGRRSCQPADRLARRPSPRPSGACDVTWASHLAAQTVWIPRARPTGSAGSGSPRGRREPRRARSPHQLAARGTKFGAGSGRCCSAIVAEFKYLTWTGENLLRQVVYEVLREDKPAAEVRRPVPSPKADLPKRHQSSSSDLSAITRRLWHRTRVRARPW